MAISGNHRPAQRIQRPRIRGASQETTKECTVAETLENLLIEESALPPSSNTFVGADACRR